MQLGNAGIEPSWTAMSLLPHVVFFHIMRCTKSQSANRVWEYSENNMGILFSE